MEFLSEKPAAYLTETCDYLREKTGTEVTESCICRFLQRNNITRKTLSSVALQREDALFQQHLEDCAIYQPEMLVFIGIDKRSAKRKFG